MSNLKRLKVLTLSTKNPSTIIDFLSKNNHKLEEVKLIVPGMMKAN